jgi:hypothetical protein
MAAFFAISLRFRADSFSARAFPPLLAPSADNATACGLRVSGADGGALPVAMSTTRLAFWEKSNRVLARVGMP